MRVGLVFGGTDWFLRPVEAELGRRHTYTRFRPRFLRLPLIGARVNRWWLARQLQCFLRAHDVVLFEWATDLLVVASRLPGRGRIVTRLHSVEILSSAPLVEWSKVDAAIVLNERYRSYLRTISPTFPSHVAVIANGVDLTRFAPCRREFAFRVGMVCRLDPRKRVYEAILCIHRLRQMGHPYVLRIVSSPNRSPSTEELMYHQALEYLTARLGLTEVVLFDGYVRDVAGWLRDVDVFVSNSYFEGQQISLLEAMSSGCYCLSHIWEGAEEILPSDNLFVSEADLCQRLIEYATWPEGRRRVAQERMRALAEERFDERRMVGEIVGLLERVASAQASP